MKLMPILIFAILFPSAVIAESQFLPHKFTGISFSGESEPVAQQKKPVKSQKPLDISRRDAIRKVKSQYRGKVLKAESTRVKGRSGYRIKMLSGEGVIFYIYVDATSGRVSKRSR